MEITYEPFVLAFMYCLGAYITNIMLKTLYYETENELYVYKLTYNTVTWPWYALRLIWAEADQQGDD